MALRILARMTAATTPSGSRSVAAASRSRAPLLRGRRGHPLLLLHGLGGSAANWVELVAALAAATASSCPTCPATAVRRGARPGAGMATSPTWSRALIEHEERRARRSSRDTPSAASSRSGSRTDGPTSSGGSCWPRPQGSRPVPGRRSGGLRRRAPAAGPLGRAVPVPLSERALVPAALFQPWFVADPLALSPRATVGFLEARWSTSTRARPRARCWPTIRASSSSTSAARRSCSGGRATRSCRSTTRSSTRAGCVRGFASSRTAATS